MIRFLHTADLQLGKPFSAVLGDSGARLRDLRLDVLDQIGQLAKEREADFVVVAGDVFDANTVQERVVAQACSRLSRFPCPVYLLPGNHDALEGPNAVLCSRTFRDQQPVQAKVLDDTVPRSVAGGRAVLLPAPLLRRKTLGDTTAHMEPSLGRDLGSGVIRIGVAHGGVVGFEGQDGESTNLIAPDRAQRAELDYLALGDWHGTYRVDDRTWYSGTPEPTHHRGNDQGNLLVVEIEHSGALPAVERVPVARTRWIRQEVELWSDEDLSALDQWFGALDRPEDSLVRLELRGRLSLKGRGALDRLLNHYRARLLDLRVRGAAIGIEASPDELAQLGGEGYLRAVVEGLREQSQGEGEEAVVAMAALQLLHQLHSDLDPTC